jgi:hypothetical protein
MFTSQIYRRKVHTSFPSDKKTVEVVALRSSGRDCLKPGGAATPIIKVGDRGYAIIRGKEVKSCRNKLAILEWLGWGERQAGLMSPPQRAAMHAGLT